MSSKKNEFDCVPAIDRRSRVFRSLVAFLLHFCTRPLMVPRTRGAFTLSTDIWPRVVWHIMLYRVCPMTTRGRYRVLSGVNRNLHGIKITHCLFHRNPVSTVSLSVPIIITYYALGRFTQNHVGRARHVWFEELSSPKCLINTTFYIFNTAHYNCVLHNSKENICINE